MMHSIIYSGVREHHDTEALRKLLLLNTFLVLGFVALVLMGIIALMQQAMALGITDFAHGGALPRALYLSSPHRR